MLKPKMILLIAIFAAFLPTFAADCKNRTVSRKDLEEMFGQATGCFSKYTVCVDASGKSIKCVEPAGYVCFDGKLSQPIKAQFDSSDCAINIGIIDAMNFYHARTVAEQILMLNGRGKFLKKEDVKTGSQASCFRSYIEEYQYLSMLYWERGCQNAAPGGITITWK